MSVVSQAIEFDNCCIFDLPMIIHNYSGPRTLTMTLSCSYGYAAFTKSNKELNCRKVWGNEVRDCDFEDSTCEIACEYILYFQII